MVIPGYRVYFRDFKFSAKSKLSSNRFKLYESFRCVKFIMKQLLCSPA